METVFDVFSSLSQSGVQLALNSLWLGLIITGVVWFLFRHALSTPAGIRHQVWWAILILILALPIAMMLPLSFGIDSAPVKSTVITPKAHASAPTVAPEGRVERSPGITRPVAPSEVSSLEAQPMPPIEGSRTAASDLSLRLLPLLATSLWIALAGLGMARLVRTFRSMNRIKAASRPFDVSHLPRIAALQRPGLRRPIQINLSNDIDSPMAAGLGSPIVLIPDRVAAEMADDDLEAIILHELAHLLRWDDWTKLAQKIVQTLFFFHPAVYMVGRQLELERELACDEWVIAQTGAVDRYARCLTRLVQLSNGTATSLIPGVLSGRKQIFKRFERLLFHTPGEKNGKRSHARLFVLVAMLAVTALLGAQMVPAITVPFKPLTLAELSAVLTVDATASDSDDDGDGARTTVSTRSSSSARSSSSSRSFPAQTIGTAYVIDGEVHGATVETKPSGTVTTTYRADDDVISATVSGRVRLTADDRGIYSISRRGSFEMTVTEEGESKLVTAERGADQEIEYAYFVDDVEKDFDEDAREWFADKLEDFIDKTGFGREERLREQVRDGGLYGALEYIEEDVASHARRYYYESLAEIDHLGKQDMRRIREHALENLTDEYDRESIRELIARRIEEVQRSSEEYADAVRAERYGNRYAAAVQAQRKAERAEEYASRFVGEGSSYTTVTISDDTGSRRPRRSGDVEGEWEGRYKRSRNRLQLSMFTYDGHTQMSFPVEVAELDGLTENDITGDFKDIRFEYRRDPGTFVFEGEIGRRQGGGDFEFVPNEDYVEKMVDLGFRESKLDNWGLFSLAVHEVNFDYVTEMLELVADRITIDDLVSMSIHDVDPDYVRQFKELGYEDLDADDLVSFSIHDVDPEFVVECQQLGYDWISPDKLVELSIHDVDLDFITELAELGLDDMPLDDLVSFSIHDVDPEFIKECHNLGYTHLDTDDLVSMAIHDVDADYIRDLIDLGLTDIPLDDLVTFRIHDVTPRYISEFKELGYDRLDPDELTTFRIHDVTPRYVRELAELGYEDIHPDDLVSMKIHDVTPSFIRRLQKRGWDDLDVEELIDIKIHGL
jgi:beta-lactamase regulating signal transducer with metallopeptidase domain